MKKAVSILMAFMLVFSLCTISVFAAKPADKNVQDTAVTTSGIEAFEPVPGGMADISAANDEKLVEMLKNQGKIAANATSAEIENALAEFLRAKANSNSSEKGILSKQAAKVKDLVNEELSNGVLNGQGIKKGLAKQDVIDNVQLEAWNGEVTEVKVLALLIDFPDFPHNNMSPEETDNYYEDFSTEFYNAKLFGDNGFLSPLGDQLYSMKQYYEEQSGGSFTISGQVAGWYTAKNPAAYYGGNYPGPDDSDARPRNLVYEAILAAAQDPNINLEDFDKEDPFDLDGDYKFMESDGIIDHIMVFHAGAGEEAGGGRLGGDAIWAHSWDLGGVAPIPGTTPAVDYFGANTMYGYTYTIVPEDAGTVINHEFGHDIGLPDEYDTIYSGAGEPVAYWSLMASGNWTGKISGTEAAGFSPYGKQMLQAIWGGNWLTGTVIDFEDINNNEFLLDQASTKGTNNDVIRINLPNKEVRVNQPTSGVWEYYSGKGNDLDHSMTAAVDLTAAATATLNFKTWYQIEEDWDYASVKVNGVSIPGNITITTSPYGQNPGNGITGYSNGWIDASFDLSAFAGQSIVLEFNYWTDVAAVEQGFYVDDIQIVADGNIILSDDAEGEALFTLGEFIKDAGGFSAAHYYLVEWRNHQGVDSSLANIRRGASLMSYEPGMVIWYVDESYDNNWTGLHPGDGYVGIVDADQHTNIWSDKALGSTRYQMHDAAFSIQNYDQMYLQYPTFYMSDNFVNANPMFDDSNDFTNPGLPDAGRNITSYGIKIRVVGESQDQSVGKILIYR
ncbi:MAG: protease [Clostridia bacterium]|jgi:immune inhibitor A|nr:protease [Clostridia bacterium]